MTRCAVIFDLDGTLLDTLADLADAVNQALTELGFPTHPEDAYRYFVGNGAATLARRAVPEDADDAAAAACLERFQAAYAGLWDRKTRPYPGAVELLEALAERGVARAVLSNKPHAFTQRCVEALLPGQSFAAVLGQRDGIPHKPDPAGALEIAARLELDPEAFLYVGDTATDMETAQRAGMFAVGVLWGFRPRSELEAAGADALIDHPRDLLGCLD